MNIPSIEQLLEDLKNPDEQLRQTATMELWRRWFNQKGDLGLELLRRSQAYLEIGEDAKAEEILSEAINRFPDFAEAWNRRAVFYYTQQQYEKSKSDCEQVVKLSPYHFGAWHGLGLCHAALGNYLEAIGAFRKALEIQPYALINQQLILECTTHL
jgi:tetratricopeptide (TPR) repeat protein